MMNPPREAAHRVMQSPCQSSAITDPRRIAAPEPDLMLHALQAVHGGRRRDCSDLGAGERGRSGRASVQTMHTNALFLRDGAPL